MTRDSHALRAEFRSLSLTDDPSQVRDRPARLTEFQQNLRKGGIALSW